MRMLEEQHVWASVHCTGHMLQIIVNSAIKEPSIGRDVGAARNLVVKRAGQYKTETETTVNEHSTAQADPGC